MQQEPEDHQDEQRQNAGAADAGDGRRLEECAPRIEAENDRDQHEQEDEHDREDAHDLRRQAAVSISQ